MPERNKIKPPPKETIPALSPMEYEFEAELMKLLAHPGRLAVIDQLLEGPKTVKELWSAMKLPQSTVSQHLALLRGRGVVLGRREANSVTYEVIHPIVRKLCKILAESRKLRTG